MLFMAVLLGAFGAHGLEKMVEAAKLKTFETGVRYHFYHGFGLILIGLLGQVFKIEIKKVFILFLLGIILFSFNCYLYVIFQLKIFAMIVPVGGTCFLLGWANLVLKLVKTKEA